MNENQLKRIKQVYETVKTLRAEFMNEFCESNNSRQAEKNSADIKRMTQIITNCRSIIDREKGVPCKTDTNEQNTSTKIQEKSSETGTLKNLVTESKRQK